MATVTVSPNPIRVGQSPTILGEGFAASTPVALHVVEVGFHAEIISNAGGLVSNDDMADHATGTLTSAGVFNPGDTVVLGSRTYTFRATLTGAADEVLIGAAATNSLDNLKAAVNGAAGAGSTYGTGTLPHAQIAAGNKTATTLVFHARLAGTDGNSLATTETGTNISFGGGTLTGGAADPTGFKLMDWTPPAPGTYTVTASDGTNSATTRVQVFASS